MNEKIEKKSGKGSRLEAVLALMLLTLIVLSVAFAVVLTVDYIQSLPDEPNHDPNNDPPTANAVFSGGIVPSMPVSDSNTKNVALDSTYGVIVDVENGKVLAGKNADTQFEPASMTKVMALIVACEKLTQEDLQKQITYTEYYADYEYNGLALGIPSGNFDATNDRFLIQDLLYGVGVMSAGDCTLMIAEYTHGSMDAFVAAMNQKVTELGLTKTHFVNASGNDDVDGNVTTAKEMAVIMAYAMQCPLICDILSVDYYSYTAEYTDQDGSIKTYPRAFKSTLFEYDGCIDKNNRMYRYKLDRGVAFKLETIEAFMGKTGYLDEPQRSYLVCAGTGKATKNRYVAVVGESGKFASTMDDIKLLFDNYAE